MPLSWMVIGDGVVEQGQSYYCTLSAYREYQYVLDPLEYCLWQHRCVVLIMKLFYLKYGGLHQVYNCVWQL